MILPINFLSGADAELQRAFNQFEDYQEGFGVEFLTAVDAYLSGIAVFPESPLYIFKQFGAKSCKDSLMGFSTSPIPRGFWLSQFSISGRTRNPFSAGLNFDFLGRRETSFTLPPSLISI